MFGTLVLYSAAVLASTIPGTGLAYAAGLAAYALAMRSAVLTSSMLLPGEKGGGVHLVNDAVCPPISLRAPYAIPSTDDVA
eukprot:373166-Rhodomonas_salina.1